MALAVTACAGKSTTRGGSSGGAGSDGSGATGGNGTGGSAGKGGSGGSAGKGASGGTGGSTSGKGGTSGTGGGGDAFFFTPLRHEAIERVDLLLMVDNSLGMDDKQQLLSEAIPTLVNRLTSPACLDQTGAVVASDGGACPPGSEQQFVPVTDLHVGVVTSSLGSHGGDQCVTDEKIDYAQLLGTRRAGLLQWNNGGFLSWDPGGTHTPSGEMDAAAFVDAFRSHVESAGGTGCGYESSLEAWYRFLIDPEPVSDMANDGAVSVRGAINGAVLAQREMFLRPDSALIIVMLSDENDCSILDEDGTQGWLVSHTGTPGSPFRMPRASSACAEDPNSPCCRMCADDSAAGCPDNASDTECQKGIFMTSTAEDHPNLRCHRQMQRFGVDLLYPTARYVEGLTSPTLLTRAGVLVPNPLFTPRHDSPARDPSSVMLVGIVGVPWQDVADPAGFRGRSLRLLTAEELAAPDPAIEGRTRWDLMLGSPGNFPPLDPHMLEQIDPRPTGAQHPLLNGPEFAIAPPDATGRPNAINGHEQNVVGRDDLQYACIFELQAPIACDSPAAMGNDAACECNASEYDYNRPTCSYTDAGASEGVQEYAKALPGVRQLELLRDLGSRAVVGSICPKNTAAEGSPEADPYYGYNPIVHAVAERFERMATPNCLARPITFNQDGSIACRVVQSIQSPDCGCDAPLRPLPEGEDPGFVNAVLAHLEAVAGQCGATTGVDCASMCLCELPQVEGLAALADCSAGSELTDAFCYSDSGPPVDDCPADEKRVIRLPAFDFPQYSTLNLICEG